MISLRSLIIVAFAFCCCSEEDPPHAFEDGDIIIGGLIPVHKKTNRSTVPGPLSCEVYDFRTFLHTQVMIYAIREINQRTPRPLPNFTLGYDIYDTCGDVSIAIRAVLRMLKNQTCVQSAPSEHKTKAVIGERHSDVSIGIAEVVALSSVAQISYGSTSEQLSRKVKFPTFLRTIPSDEHQTNGIAKLVQHFNWKTVAIIGSEDSYGRFGSDHLVTLFREMKDLCIEFSEILPDNFPLNNSKTHERLDKLVHMIRNSSAEAIIVFTRDTNVNIIMEAAAKHNLNRTWIASDTWSTSTWISSIPGIERVGEVFGFISKRNEVPGFRHYVTSMFNGTRNGFINHYLSKFQLCSNQSDEEKNNSCLQSDTEKPMQCLTQSCLATYIDQDETYNLYLAVQVIVEALRHLLKCDDNRCEHSGRFTALELLMELKKVNFTVKNKQFFFNSDGNPNLGYDIVYWNMSAPKQKIQSIGEYWPWGKINISDHLVRDNSTLRVSAYNCSKTCKPGQELKIQNKKCCSHCVPCANGEFSPRNGEKCKRCADRMYSSPKRDKCLRKIVISLNWSDPFVIILKCLEICGMIVTIAFAIVFTIYRHTPIVKAVGGYLCFFELFCLLICFALTFAFTVFPTKISCMVGLPIFCMTFSLCMACVLVNLLQILLAFTFDMKEGGWKRKFNQPVVMVTVISGIQVALCVSWLYFYPPSPDEEYLSNTIEKLCDSGSNAFLIAALAYNAVLALFCFLFAYKGKAYPDLYKNANLITSSMLLYLVLWILFIPIYTSLHGVYKQAIEGAAILISCYSILFCHLAPKCYIMVFRKEINNENAITEYIRKHYEQKGMPVVQS